MLELGHDAVILAPVLRRERYVSDLQPTLNRGTSPVVVGCFSMVLFAEEAPKEEAYDAQGETLAQVLRAPCAGAH